METVIGKGRGYQKGGWAVGGKETSKRLKMKAVDGNQG